MARLWLISYDIADPHRLYRVARILEKVGERAQESVFEGWLNGYHLRKLLWRLEQRIDPEQDSLRCYPLSANCVVKLRWQGQGTDAGGAQFWLV